MRFECCLEALQLQHSEPKTPNPASIPKLGPRKTGGPEVSALNYKPKGLGVGFSRSPELQVGRHAPGILLLRGHNAQLCLSGWGPWGGLGARV